MTPPEGSTTTTSAAAAGADTAERPYVLIVSHALSGHLAPMMRIASSLRDRGWRVFFLGPTAHRARIEASGAVFLPLRGDADLDDRAYYDPGHPPVPGYDALPWYERVLVDLERQCIAPLPTQWACLREALRDLYLLQARNSSSSGKPRQVLVLAEAFFLGALPLRHGAPLLPLPSESESESEMPRPRSICVSVTVPAIRSRDLPPLGYTAFPFDASAAGRERNAQLWTRSWARRAAPLTALLAAKMREAGATTEPWSNSADGGEGVFLEGENYLCHERILQLGVPGFEYPRSDWPAGFRFAGLAQGGAVNKGQGKDPDFPWWPEIVANSALERGDPRRKKVVVVTQGTVEINPEDLILPTIRAFDPSTLSSSSSSSSPSISENDILIIAILGWKDARLIYTRTNTDTTTVIATVADDRSEEQKESALPLPLPPNTRIADYLSYDAALAHADVWVHNGGFGAVCHGIAHGVPMVVAGEGMDKGENARRVAWSGIGVDLGCARPSTGQVREAIVRVLLGSRGDDTGERSFAERVEVLRRESEELDCGGIVEEELLRLMG
ncbi:hypothetical protein SLS62_002957 [Diatrype stigma]|uniref:Erythromycin biosynthesis protein CIII-like C-terminal domain-containing protein n=1 Tax=Diatrype stigma TaxID=117547 RepID=A0AAN9UXJ8_9PEZI